MRQSLSSSLYLDSSRCVLSREEYVSPGGNSVHAVNGGLGHLAPGFQIRIHLILIQHFRLNADPDPGFYDQKIEKNLRLKKN
jgi:hypothetical protein